MELAPVLDLSHLIVDLVDTGSTLRANGLEETHTIAHVTSRLIVNRTALKTRPERITAIINRFRTALASSTVPARTSRHEAPRYHPARLPHPVYRAAGRP